MKPGQYIWNAKHSDQPVTVVKVLGKGPDGRTYVQIEGTSTGIPADELKPAPSYSFMDKFKKLLGL